MKSRKYFWKTRFFDFFENHIQKYLNIHYIILYNGCYIIYSISSLFVSNFLDILCMLNSKYIF
jgi:hypothetical protein